MASLCESLKNEHRIIERVLNALSAETDRLDDGAPPNGIFILSAIAFIRQFADGLHHKKEEQILYPRLQAAGLPGSDGPIGVMLTEHHEGRQHIDAIENILDAALSGDTVAIQNVSYSLRRCVSVLQQNIEEEDQILYPMAEQLLGDTQKVEILAAFRNADIADGELVRRETAWAESLGQTPVAVPVTEPVDEPEWALA